LDNNLVRPNSPDLLEKGVDGAMWAVHGGGFYNPQKYMVAPKKIHTPLHWFYWESYSTWLSGFALFTVSYLWSASTYLIDKSKMDWAPATAIAVALAFLVVFWLLYDLICRTLGQRKHGDAIVGGLVFLLVCLASWLACHWFAGRAAFLLVGAMLATSMSASVFFWIIPGQKKVIAAIKAGQPVDPVHGQRGKQRSVHNTYFTLPVLFAMLSGHYSFTYNHPQNWLVLILMMFAGAAIRQFFVLRHGYKLGRQGHPWRWAVVGMLVLVAVIVWLRPPAVATDSVAKDPISTGPGGQFGYKDLQPVLAQRCHSCHGEQVQMKNVRLDSAALVRQHAATIYQQVVVAKAMPMNNATGLTESERQLFKQWFEAGARVD
jgi:uncharacterized membrane protein